MLMRLLILLAAAAVCLDPQMNLRDAESFFRQGQYERALAAASEVIERDRSEAEPYRVRAAAYEALGRHERAAADWSRYIELRPSDAAAYQARGVVNFKAGKIRASIADFDRYLKAHPEREPHHWQRGIAYYYAGEFKKGVRQFEIHRTVNPQDVENAIWHYLCKARTDGTDTAQVGLIEIAGDRRPWAMIVYRLYQGRATPEQALAQAAQLDGSDEERQINLFYANLYVALFFEAEGDAEKARQAMATAVQKFPCSHYMGDVARVHLNRTRG
jgi:lipoprotein NlpI